jgi:glucose/arabinose dehydrogenase
VRRLACVTVSCLTALILSGCGASGRGAAPACDALNAGLDVADGFCALVVADAYSVGSVRHLLVTDTGQVIVGAVARDNKRSGLFLLRDPDGDGRAERQETLTDRASLTLTGRDGLVYFSDGGQVLRYVPNPNVPFTGRVESVISGLPAAGTHPGKGLAFDTENHLYVSIGSASNVCADASVSGARVGQDPCPELDNRAGIWRFPADRLGMTMADGQRIATGIRNTIALAWHPGLGRLLALQQGIERLEGVAPAQFTEAQGAATPAEELLTIAEGDDYGWPYCYQDTEKNTRVLSPLYAAGPDTDGRCDRFARPSLTFPAHWLPTALLVHSGTGLPARYRGGLFIVFGGPAPRTPLAEDGLRVVFVPVHDGVFGEPEDFATGFARTPSPDLPRWRPSGVAEGPDGSIYISDNVQGRVWRIRPDAPT